MEFIYDRYNHFQPSLGYVGSYTDKYYNMLSIKFDFPFKYFIYKLHTRSDFDKRYEWWQEITLKWQKKWSAHQQVEERSHRMTNYGHY